MQSPVLQYAAALIFGYLCGSIPFGVLLTRFAGAPDLRTVGSGNIGATNVLRTGRKFLAAATLAGDILKGTFAVAVIGFVFSREPAREDWGGWVATFADPDGNVLQLMQLPA